MIGDPSGRSEERNLLDEDTLGGNVESIRAQLSRFLDFEPGPTQARLVDNRDWTGPMQVLEFLRDVGKHVTVNAMLAKESVRSRVQSEAGISFTEFSYMLLQANDYRWLHANMGCELQVGGSDQWGNITAGIDLIRRVSGDHVHGLTVPLMVRSDGAKFGKTADGAVWLDPGMTSPYRLHQYCMQVDDRDVERMLLHLTLLSVDEVRHVVGESNTNPSRRVAQRALADSVTEMVHGAAARNGAAEAAGLLFSNASEPGSEAFEILSAEIPAGVVPRQMLEQAETLVELLVQSGASASKSAARRAIQQGSVYVNGVRRTGADEVDENDVRHGRWILLRTGKRNHHLVEIAG